jgi:hypothetical protein
MPRSTLALRSMSSTASAIGAPGSSMTWSRACGTAGPMTPSSAGPT